MSSGSREPLLERITEVIRQHHDRQECDCEWDDDSHTAAAVLAALNLTDEWSYVTEGDVENGALFPDESEITDDRAWAEQQVEKRCQSCDTCRNAQPKRLIRRSVGPWLPVGERRFTDSHGRRWEWCGGVEGTWAWRITDGRASR